MKKFQKITLLPTYGMRNPYLARIQKIKFWTHSNKYYLPILKIGVHYFQVHYFQICIINVMRVVKSSLLLLLFDPFSYTRDWVCLSMNGQMHHTEWVCNPLKGDLRPLKNQSYVFNSLLLLLPLQSFSQTNSFSDSKEKQRFLQCADTFWGPNHVSSTS